MKLPFQTVCLTLFLAAFMASCSKIAPGTQGEGEPLSEVREVRDFHGIENATHADVYLRQDKDFKVEVMAQKNIAPLLKTELTDGLLHIYFSENVGNTEGLKILVSGPNFDELSMAGSGNLFIESDLQTKLLRIAVAGSANVTGSDHQLSVQGLDAKISGSGNISLSGTAETADLAISGSGEMSLFNLRINKATVSVTGSGDIDCTVQQTLKATVTGTGNISYKGPATVESDVTGSGSITKID